MTSELLAPFRLGPRFSERIWGKPDLKPWYDSTGTSELVGEAWLTGPDCPVETGTELGKSLKDLYPEFPLLVKMLFPNDKLSVQVHPDDEQAQALGLARGKTECWYVLEAEPGSTVACGLKEGVTPEQVRTAALDGSMESLMEMVPVSVGDMVFVDAGTVHAIGPGLVLLEVQQTCDVTYRMFDYGRPRELHLEKGLAVMRTKTAAGKVAPREMDGFVRLIEQKYFVVDRFDIEGEELVSMTGPGCLVALSGEGVVIVPGEEEEVELTAGKAVVVPEGWDTVVVESLKGMSFVRCVAPV
ncbi:mannose-6-phosphate isomerase [Granulicella sp. WH15]|uniref:type I phosphomannose isomerase catalytic subunit n=1 Tax=Granulicella sp. WH15 TaxID=2602070 RepID=UPI00136793AC|nr:type I phosphomannose isomerase catalytic subunit [Granulicella sp. WH15]QHN04048.1 mannose-6-phosphate isomerase [Granulicella sp. WH15]